MIQRILRVALKNYSACQELGTIFKHISLCAELVGASARNLSPRSITTFKHRNSPNFKCHDTIILFCLIHGILLIQ